MLRRLKVSLVALAILLCSVLPALALTGPTTYTTAQRVAITTQGASGAVYLQITGTASSPVYSFQCSLDGTTWNAQPAIVLTSGLVTSSSVAVTGNFVIPAAGCNYVAVNLTSISSGNFIVTYESGNGPAPWLAGPITTDGQRATYDAAVQATGAGATTNDMCALPGSATKTIKVLLAELTMVATSAADIAVVLSKRSAANTGTAGTAMTAVPRNSAFVAVSAAPVSWANSSSETPGAAVGNISADYVQLAALAAGLPTVLRKTFAASDNSSPIVLTGTAQVIAWNLAGASTPSGLIFTCRFSWIEE